jgi:hypothetical protein
MTFYVALFIIYAALAFLQWRFISEERGREFQRNFAMYGVITISPIFGFVVGGIVVKLVANALHVHMSDATFERFFLVIGAVFAIAAPICIYRLRNLLFTPVHRRR